MFMQQKMIREKYYLHKRETQEVTFVEHFITVFKKEVTMKESDVHHSSHLSAQPCTQAPYTLAVIPGHTDTQTFRDPPGHTLVSSPPSSPSEAGAAAEGDDGGEDTKVCPGGSLDICVSVCPGITARVYGACVQGCADRCTQ